MNKLTTSRKTPIALLFALGVVLLIPVISFAQGRGNGKGQGKPDKCAKFVNCHDARDGRVDGRGPAINPAVIPVNQPPILYPSRRNGGQNNQIYYPRRNRQGQDDDDNNNQTGTWRRRRHDSGNTDPNNQNGTWRRRRNGGSDTETRNRRVRRNDRSNVID